MKQLLATVAAAVLALAPVACNKGDQGGTPGTEQTFSLTTSAVPTRLKQGEEKTVIVTVRRDDKFTEPVAIKVDSQTKDVKAETTKSTAENADKEITIKVRAEKDAAFGDHIVKVIGTPKSGKDSTLQITVTVDKP